MKVREPRVLRLPENHPQLPAPPILRVSLPSSSVGSGFCSDTFDRETRAPGGGFQRKGPESHPQSVMSLLAPALGSLPALCPLVAVSREHLTSVPRGESHGTRTSTAGTAPHRAPPGDLGSPAQAGHATSGLSWWRGAASVHSWQCLLLPGPSPAGRDLPGPCCLSAKQLPSTVVLVTPESSRSWTPSLVPKHSHAHASRSDGVEERLSYVTGLLWGCSGAVPGSPPQAVL